MNATTLIPVKSITVNQAEGKTGQLLKGTFTTWEAANSALREIQEQAPKGGGCLKTDVVVTWADGMQVKVEEAVANSDKYTADMAANVRNTWLYYGGLRKPPQYTEEQYEKATSDLARRDTAVAYLKKYDLNDRALEEALAEADKKLTLIPASELNEAIDRVARLLARIESPEMKSAMSDAQIRSASLDMRRALASLIRVRDATPNATS